jgi:hypothetical protein
VQLVGIDRRAARQRRDRTGGQRRHPDLDEGLGRQVAYREAQRVLAPDLLLPVRSDEEQRQLVQTAADDAHEVERCLIGPMDIVEDDERAGGLGSEVRQECVEDARAVALLEDGAQQAVGMRSHVGDGRERARRHDGVAHAPECRAGRTLPAKGFDQGRLADARLSCDQDEPAPGTGVFELPGQTLEQRLALE